METFRFDDCIITLNKEGATTYSKVSFPIRYGRYHEITTPEYAYQFNLNGEIKFIKGLMKDWPDPSEWLKRTVANDWVYYSVGGYAGVYEGMGEYYLPCFNYSSNTISNRRPFDDTGVIRASESFYSLSDKIARLRKRGISKELSDFLHRVITSNPEILNEKAQKLHHIIGSSIPVLPPDTRHVDYDVIPIMVADGCLYNCGFCRVKSGQSFACRSPENISEQISALKAFYGRDLLNYNSIFLGQHDALFAGKDIIEFAVRKACDIFEFERSFMRGGNVFIFGSVDSLLDSDDGLFQLLNRLPLYTVINIGFESADEATLFQLKKAVDIKKIHSAFNKMLKINKRYENIEITANFLISENLPNSHLPSIFAMTGNYVDRFYNKGTLYFSPLINGASNDVNADNQREHLAKFFDIKRQLPLPSFIYLIQRL